MTLAAILLFADFAPTVTPFALGYDYPAVVIHSLSVMIPFVAFVALYLSCKATCRLLSAAVRVAFRLARAAARRTFDGAASGRTDAYR